MSGAAWQTHAEEQVHDEYIKALYQKQKRKINSNWKKKILSSTTFGSNLIMHHSSNKINHEPYKKIRKNNTFQGSSK